MSTKKLASELAASGRYGDEFLLHVNGDELLALDALAPDGLTINPDTGLPEAFSLGDLLPAVIGIGGAMMGMPTWAIAATNAGVTTAKTGDLGKGLMAGALSYGAGSLAEGLSTAGSQAATEAATNAAGEGLNQMGADAFGQAAADAAVTPASQGAFDNFMTGASDLGNWGDVLGQEGVYKPLGMAALGMASQEETGEFAEEPAPEDVSYGPGPQPNLGKYRSSKPDERGREVDHFYAGGGNIFSPGIGDSQFLLGQAVPEKAIFDIAKGKADFQDYYDPLDFFQLGPGKAGKKRQAKENEAHLENLRKQGFEFAEGGAISGPGGGLDDLVPATIEGKVPARLSNDEFVIPADIVSAIGDGSSNAGHKRLYDLIKVIREEKFGDNTQPPKLKKGLQELMKLHG